MTGRNAVFLGVLEADVLLGAVSSLKHKRAVIRPVLARLRRLDVAVAEGGDPDLHRRATIGVSTVSGESARVVEVLDTCERLVAGEPELELLSVRRRVVSVDDL
ncbi:DUF503 domain-containing protein [Nakamurella endophytica]|uniref:DUF503 domain-containing protein n=1 Tax=Nakamurella endophytica TaxID=1748367 RepID=UPI001E4A3869|nr:DUF503 domain-containing protein [Nakamurella endophytica]